MLTAAIASTLKESSSQLTACLLQTGLVASVREWALPLGREAGRSHCDPDVVFVDFSEPQDSGSRLVAAGHIRQFCPSAIVLAYSSVQPTPNTLLEAMRSGVQDFLSQSLSPALLAETLARLIPEKATKVGSSSRLIATVGAKGGVGTTTIAVNLGVHLRQATQKRVALLDFGRPLGHAGVLLNLETQFSLGGTVQALSRFNANSFSARLVRHQSGLEVLAGTSHPDDWRRLGASELARLVALAQADFDYVIVDSGSIYSSQWRSILDRATVLLVSEANVSGLASLERHLSSLADLGVPPEQIHIVINRWHRRDEEILRGVEKRLRRPVFAKLPNDFQRANETARTGSPLSDNENNRLGARFRELACRLASVSIPRNKKRGAFAHLFSSSLALWQSQRATVPQRT